MRRISDKESAKSVEKIIHRLNKVDCYETEEKSFFHRLLEFLTLEDQELTWKGEHDAVIIDLQAIELNTTDKMLSRNIHHSISSAVNFYSERQNDPRSENETEIFYQSAICKESLEMLVKNLKGALMPYGGYHEEL